MYDAGILVELLRNTTEQSHGLWCFWLCLQALLPSAVTYTALSMAVKLRKLDSLHLGEFCGNPIHGSGITCIPHWLILSTAGESECPKMHLTIVEMTQFCMLQTNRLINSSNIPSKMLFASTSSTDCDSENFILECRNSVNWHSFCKSVMQVWVLKYFVLQKLIVVCWSNDQEFKIFLMWFY